jgi:glucose-1-phosphate cytidylyltransferase
MADMTIDLANNVTQYHSHHAEPWKVTLLDTGENTMTGGRIKRAEPYIKNETFMLTYGDGVSDIDITELLTFHRSHKKSITMTSVQPEGKFGALSIDAKNQKVLEFREKPKGDGAWITLRGMIPYSKKNRWKNWQKTENYTLTNIKDFGNPWIHSGTKINWKNCCEKE